MAGCDYLPSIRGIGLCKAIDLFERFGDKLNMVVGHLRYNKSFMGKVPTDYEQAVKQIALIFQY